MAVAPFVGAWIEILTLLPRASAILSLRSSERGLKFEAYRVILTHGESLRSSERGLKLLLWRGRWTDRRSLRSSERGLKLYDTIL